MSNVGKPERATQNRVVALFRDELGYRYLGDRADRLHNSNIEEGTLTDYLTGAGYTAEHISRALHRLSIEANNPNRLRMLDRIPAQISVTKETGGCSRLRIVA